MAPSVGTTHHLKLGDEFLMIRPNSYQKGPAPTFGARIATGDPDYNNLSIWQHWVQKCWIGGMGAEEWVDDAMFDNALGLDTTEHEKVRLSRILKRGTGTGWTLGGYENNVGYRFIVYRGNLYCLKMMVDADSKLYKYTVSTQTWSTVSMPGSGFEAKAIAVFDGKLFVAGGSANDNPKLHYATTPGSWTTLAAPASEDGHPIHSIKVYNARLYVAFNSTIWRLKGNQKWDGKTAFYKVNANSGSNYISAMENHLGFLYMLSDNGHLHRTDGNNTFDIWSWDGQTKGVSLRSYDGKLFVGTYEYTDTVNIGYGVLYQFTGAAVTELKRWGKSDKATSIGQMVTYNRRLFYGASSMLGEGDGFGIACYDSVEDAHSIYAIQDDSVSYADTSGVGTYWLVDDVFVFGGRMFCAVRGHGVFMTPDSFGDVNAGLSRYTTGTSGGVVTSSIYDGGTPGLMKFWRTLTVWCDLPADTTSMKVYYSLDNGVTWVNLGTEAGPSTTGQYQFHMSNIQSVRFQYRVTLVTTDETKTPLLHSVSVSYLPQPEPNWQWSFTVPVSDTWVLMDDSEEDKDTNALIAYLEGLYRAGDLVTFVDIDGTSWASNGAGVLVYDISTVHFDIESPREADVRITLLEAVESY